MVKNGQIWSKMAKNGQKWPKMVKNGGFFIKISIFFEILRVLRNQPWYPHQIPKIRVFTSHIAKIVSIQHFWGCAPWITAQHHQYRWYWTTLSLAHYNWPSLTTYSSAHLPLDRKSLKLVFLTGFLVVQRWCLGVFVWWGWSGWVGFGLAFFVNFVFWVIKSRKNRWKCLWV